MLPKVAPCAFPHVMNPCEEMVKVSAAVVREVGEAPKVLLHGVLTACEYSALQASYLKFSIDYYRLETGTKLPQLSATLLAVLSAYLFT